MGRTVRKSIAIIGEGETEWFYILVFVAFSTERSIKAL